MKGRGSFLVLIAITAVMVVAAVLSQRDTEAPTLSHGPHLPTLAEQAQAVQAIEIRSAGNRLRLARAGDGWVAADRDDYPARAERVRELVLGLAGLERLERKTADPSRFARLELSDVDQPGSKAVEISLLDGNDEALAAVLLGKTEDFQAGGRSRYYLRNAGAMQTWLVEGSLPPVPEDAANWLEQSLLPGVDESMLARVRIIHADGETLAVRRAAPEEADFELEGLRAGEKPGSQNEVNAVAGTLRRLSLKEVEPESAAAELEEMLRLEARTFGGVRIAGRVYEMESDYLVRLEARHAGAGRKEEARGDGPAGDEAAAVPDGPALADRLDQRWRGRAFVVSRYALDAVNVRRADLVEAAGEPDSG